MRFLLIILPLLLTHCTNGASHEPEPELSTAMGQFERFSTKLGLALSAGNPRLAQFYLQELRETLEDTQKTIPIHEGLPIGDLMETLLVPPLAELEKALQVRDLPRSRALWPTVIEGCNRCHGATEHEFIRIKVVRENPFSQEFALQD